MTHSFDVEIAKKYGVNCALILNNLYFWIEKNEANDKHFHDGYYWTYNSVKAFETLFPYLTSKQIRTAINTLVKEGIIIEGAYSENPYDHTKWYAITEKGKSILPKGQIDFTKRANRCTEKGKSNNIYNINNTLKTDNKTYIYYGENDDCDPDTECLQSGNEPETQDNTVKKHEINMFFEALWKAYPKKKGKGQISDAKKRVLYGIGAAEMIRCIDRYKDYVRGKDEQYVMNGSTFFNSGYVDYLDENYADGTESSDEEELLPFR